jgi:type IV secretory pathway VirB10-like protein
MPFCPNCGHSNPTTQTFCTSCGARIKSSNAVWNFAAVALALIAGLSWAAFLFSNSAPQPEPTNNQPQPLISSNANATLPVEATQPTPSPSKTAEPKPSAATPTPTPPRLAVSDEAPEERAEPDYSYGNPNVRVWVNTDSGVYHCPGTRWYGNTKYGEYMTQKEAQEGRNRPAYGNYCQ